MIGEILNTGLAPIYRVEYDLISEGEKVGSYVAAIQDTETPKKGDVILYEEDHFIYGENWGEITKVSPL